MVSVDLLARQRLANCSQSFHLGTLTILAGTGHEDAIRMIDKWHLVSVPEQRVTGARYPWLVWLLAHSKVVLVRINTTGARNWPFKVLGRQWIWAMVPAPVLPSPECRQTRRFIPVDWDDLFRSSVPHLGSLAGGGWQGWEANKAPWVGLVVGAVPFQAMC